MPSILVVDDEADVREYLSKIIARKFSCKVESAANGEEALEKLKVGTFDLVLLDIRMPGLSGIDVMNEAKVLGLRTKFLAISGYDSHEVVNEVFKAGAVDFLHKPLTAQVVELKIKELLAL